MTELSLYSVQYTVIFVKTNLLMAHNLEFTKKAVRHSKYNFLRQMVLSSLHCFHSRAKASIAKKSYRVMVSGSINLAETVSNNPEFMQLNTSFQS